MENSKKLSKKIWIPLLAVGIVAVITIVSVVLYFTVFKKSDPSPVELTISASQVDQTQTILVNWDTSDYVDNVQISVYHDGTLVSSKTICNMNQIVLGESEIEAYYGKQTVTVTVNKDDFSVTKIETVSLYSDSYVIAALNGTMPVTLFTLSLNEITSDYTIPTFVWFERSESWDFTAMPDNVYVTPVATTSEMTTTPSIDKTVMYAKTSEWIKELYEINSNSMFYLYYGDFDTYGLLQATVANGIPSNNYEAYILSDGSGSFDYFNENFNTNTETANTTYEKMKAEYETLKTQIAASGEYTLKTKNVSISAEDLRKYAYVIACEESNITWWLSRCNNSVMCPAYSNTYTALFVDADASAAATEKAQEGDPNASAVTVLNSYIEVKTLSDLLTEIQKDSNKVAILKALYNFSDTMFEEAETNNKKIMLILGTHTSTENNTNFDAYVKAVMTYYGDEYVYYYKGHPNNPTSSVEGKLEKLTNLGLIDVDSTIPAELILFFNPDVYVVGYQSTTFESTDAEHSAMVFNIRMSDARNSLGSSYISYCDKIDAYISSVSQTDETYGELVTSLMCYVIEFNSNATNYTELAYDIAIYDATSNTLTYYKYQEGSYQKVVV